MLTASAVACAMLVAGTALGRADDFQVSYATGSRDEAGRFAGGTEMRLLTPHGGRSTPATATGRTGRERKHCKAHKSWSSMRRAGAGGSIMHLRNACRTGVG
ncbi:MAG TPA: hypothetical protein VHT21_14090, partial [Stellaceae bacterium]|nr:hypothetical protein [Stellaceae bacterium]